MSLLTQQIFHKQKVIIVCVLGNQWLLTAVLDLGNIILVNRLTLDSLMDTILQHCSPGSNVITVHHARENGISLHLLPGSQARARVEFLNLLSGMRSAADIAPILRLNVAQIESLRQKMRRIQNLRLSRVEVRACHIASWSFTMQAVKRFYGTQCLGGPVRRNAYSSFRANVNSPAFDFGRYDQLDRGQSHPVTAGFVGFQTVSTGDISFRIQNARATSRRVFETWVRQFFPVGTNPIPASLIIHAQWAHDRLILPSRATIHG